MTHPDKVVCILWTRLRHQSEFWMNYLCNAFNLLKDKAFALGSCWSQKQNATVCWPDQLEVGSWLGNWFLRKRYIIQYKYYTVRVAQYIIREWLIIALTCYSDSGRRTAPSVWLAFEFFPLASRHGEIIIDMSRTVMLMYDLMMYFSEGNVYMYMYGSLY